MRKSTARFLASLAALVGIVLLASCQFPGGDDYASGSIAISFGDATSKSILPDVSMKVVEYLVEGSGPNGATFSAKTAGGSLVVDKLAFGDWAITAKGLNASGTPVGIGTAATTVRTGQTTNVSVTVRPYEGDGTLSLAVRWNAADLDVPSVEAILKPVAGADIPLAFVLNATKDEATFASAAIPAGYYTLDVKLKDNGITVMGAVEVVRIAKGATSSGVFEFFEVNKPGGTINVEIVADMGDPLDVAMSGLGANLVGTSVMNVNSSVSGGVNAVYVWYLNGESFATGTSCAISGLPDGFYRLDVTAFSADGKRAGSASGSFRAAGAIDLSPYLKIHQIQGATHISPYAGQAVTGIVGVVIAKDPKQFWIQSPVADADPATSEGLLVFTNALPAVSVGDLVVVSGTVKEYGFNNELRLTELATPTVTKTLATGCALPDAVVVGQGGRVPPALVLCDDGSVATGGVFDPENDGLDFWESLENMLVRVNGAVVTGAGTYGEVAVVADGGAGVPAGRRTSRGGVVISEGVYNPEVVLVDTDAAILGLPAPAAKTGDSFGGPIVGVMNYSYGNFLILPTSMPALVPGALPRETSDLTPASDRLTVATFNLENFPRSVDTMTPAQIDAKVADLAQTIVAGLRCPDILVVEEMTDDSYSANNGVVTANANFARLIAAIVAAGGPDTYQFRQIDPENNADGGWAGANIRVGFVYNGARVSFVDIPGGGPTSSVAVTSEGGVLGVSQSPGRISVASFAGSRKPVIGKFVFNGKPVFVIGAHLASKGGDDPLFGINQPPVLTSEVERLVQANALNAFVDEMLAVDPNANIVVGGDLNDFAFSAPVRALQGDALRNLVEELLPLSERYTYVYDGNSQQLDHLIVSPALFGANPLVDVVHRNAEYCDAERHTDHDPVLASFGIAFAGNTMPPAWISGYPAVDVTGETAATVRFKLNEVATLYYALKSDGAAAPTVAELKAGTSMALAAATEGSVAFDSLTADTPYDLYAFAVDADGNEQLGAILVEFRTKAAVVPPPQGLKGLYFSDYGEGGSNNKYLEVRNVSGAAVTLTEADGTPNFFMVLSQNGAALASGMTIYKFPNGMTIADGGLVGVYNSGSVAAIKDKMGAAASFASTVTYFNGNDPVVLVQDLNGNGAFDLGVDAVLDIVGKPGDSNNFAINVGLRRNAAIVTGNGVFDPAEWTQYPQAEVDAGTWYGTHP